MTVHLSIKRNSLQPYAADWATDRWKVFLKKHRELITWADVESYLKSQYGDDVRIGHQGTELEFKDEDTMMIFILTEF